MGKKSDYQKKNGYTKGKMWAVIILPILFFILPTVLVITLTSIGKKKISSSVGGYQNLIHNWERGAIMEIQLASGTDCPSGFEKAFVGNWPGTQSGCNCLNIKCYRKGVKDNKLIKGSCNYNSTRCGCKTVSSTPSRELWIYPNEKEFCVKRDSELRWIDLYQNAEDSGSCKDGFKKCGNVSGISKGVCIPTDKDCPLTDIKFQNSNPDPLKYTQIIGQNTKHLYWTRDNNIADPLTELWVAEDGKVCLDQNYRYLTEGRSDYVLMNKEGKHCKEDTRFSNLDYKEGEKTLFDNNGVSYSSLPAFTTNDDYKYDRVIRSMIAFKPSCRHLVKDTQEGHDSIESFAQRNKTIRVLSIVSISAGGVLMIAGIILFCNKKFKWRRFVMIIRLALSTALLVFLVIQCVKGVSKLGAFRNIGNEECADGLTNQFFIDTDKDVRKYIVTWSLLCACFLAMGILVEALVEFVLYKMKKCQFRWKSDSHKDKSWYEPFDDSPGSQDKNKDFSTNYAPPPVPGTYPYGMPGQQQQFSPSGNYNQPQNFNNQPFTPVPNNNNFWGGQTPNQMPGQAPFPGYSNQPLTNVNQMNMAPPSIPGQAF